MSTAQTLPESERLNGVSIDEGIQQFFVYTRVKRDDKGNIIGDPNIDRSDAVNRKSEGLLRIVEESLNGSKTADEAKAREIAHKFSLELAKTYGHQDGMNLPESIRESYLTTALSAMGIPGVNTINQLVESIVNMARPAARPNDQLYDANAAVVQLMSYIAGRQETSQGEYTDNVTKLVNAYQSPAKAMKIVEGVSKGGVKVGLTATPAQFQTALREFQAEQTRAYVNSMKRTYHPSGHGSDATGAIAQNAQEYAAAHKN